MALDITDYSLMSMLTMTIPLQTYYKCTRLQYLQIYRLDAGVFSFPSLTINERFTDLYTFLPYPSPTPHTLLEGESLKFMSSLCERKALSM